MVTELQLFPRENTQEVSSGKEKHTPNPSQEGNNLSRGESSSVEIELTIYDGRIYKGTGTNAKRYFLFHWITGTVADPLEVKMIDLQTMKVIWQKWQDVRKQIDEKKLIWVDDECSVCHSLVVGPLKWGKCGECDRGR